MTILIYWADQEQVGQMIKSLKDRFLDPKSRYAWVAVFIIGVASGVISWGGLNSYMGYSGIIDFCVSCGGQSFEGYEEKSKRYKECKCENVETGDVVLMLDYEKAAKALSISKQALYDLVYKGRGPVVTKIGRRTFFTIEDLKKFVAEHREGPVE